MRGFYYGAPAFNLNAPDTHMVFFDAFLDGTVCRWKTQPEYETTYPQGAPNLAGTGTPDTALGEYNFDLYTKNYIWGSLPYTWPYPYEAWGTWEDGALYLESSVPPQHQLNITRSPELGGGVIVTPPLEFPIFYCGLNGKEECDLEVNHNGQVTLEARPNPGYAFSHWEINNATMGDVDGEIDVWMNEDKNVVAVFRRVLAWPLNGTPDTRTILSSFGADWIESCSGEVMKHTGIDIGATTTDVVYAAEDGVVKVAQTDQQWGGWVTIEHDSLNNSFTTTYIHITPSVFYNDPVEKGDPIGTVVNYGGPLHLHFGLRNGSYVDTSNRGRLPQSVCGGDPAFQENFENPSDFLFE